jgi:hypothetical protein
MRDVGKVRVYGSRTAAQELEGRGTSWDLPAFGLNNGDGTMLNISLPHVVGSKDANVPAVFTTCQRKAL